MKAFNLSIVFVFCTAVLMFTYQNCTSEVTFSEVEHSSEVAEVLPPSTSTTKKPVDPCANPRSFWIATEEECMAFSDGCDGGTLGQDGTTSVPFFACIHTGCGYWRPTCYTRNCEESGGFFGLVGCGDHLMKQDGTRSKVQCSGWCRQD